MYIAKNISYRYHKKLILDDVNLTIKPGKFTIVLGPNGAGKSTLLKILSGRVPTQEGIVLLDEQPLANYPEAVLAQRRAVLPQQSIVQFPYTVKEIVMMGCVAQQISIQEKEKIAQQKLDEVNFQYPSNHNYLSLSGGEQQRVQLARVLAQIHSSIEGTKYLLLDEPTASLDIAREQQLMTIIQQLCQQGIGVMAIVHDLNLAIQYADELVFIKDGSVCSQGTIKQVVNQEIIEKVYGHPVQVVATHHADRPLIMPMSIQEQAITNTLRNKQLQLK